MGRADLPLPTNYPFSACIDGGTDAQKSRFDNFKAWNEIYRDILVIITGGLNNPLSPSLPSNHKRALRRLL